MQPLRTTSFLKLRIMPSRGFAMRSIDWLPCGRRRGSGGSPFAVRWWA